MKAKFCASIVLLMIFCLINSCVNQHAKIKYKNTSKVALYFSRAIVQQNIENAKKVSTESTHKLLNVLQTLQDAQKSNNIDSVKVADILKNMKKAKCTVENDKAFCIICCMEDETKSIESDGLHLVRESDKWMVNMTKESLQISN